MAKLSVIIYLLVALLILFLISHSPKKPSNNRWVHGLGELQKSGGIEAALLGGSKPSSISPLRKAYSAVMGEYEERKLETKVLRFDCSPLMAVDELAEGNHNGKLESVSGVAVVGGAVSPLKLIGKVNDDIVFGALRSGEMIRGGTVNITEASSPVVAGSLVRRSSALVVEGSGTDGCGGSGL